MRDKKGVILLLVFIIMAVLMTITVSLLYMRSSRLRGVAYDAASSKALWLAEAGLQDVIYKIKTDSEFRDDVSTNGNNPTAVSGSLGDGTYTVDVYRGNHGKPDENTFYLNSLGTVSVLNRRITLSVDFAESTGGSYAGGTPEAFSYAMHSFGSNTNFKNSTGTVNGDVSTEVDVKFEENMTINGTVTEGNVLEDISPVNFDTYKLAADHIESGGFTFEAGQTYSGTYYVEGSTDIEDNVTINGSVIAESNITLTSSTGVTINPASGCPALISGNNIQGTGLENSAISGLVYAENNVDFDSLKNVTLDSTIISGNNTLMRNGSGFTINYDDEIQSDPPPYFNGWEPDAPTVTPQKNWNEVVPAL